MALMSFREKNRVKWMGVRPAHDGVQVLKRAAAINSATIIHTVSAGKTLYLCYCGMQVLVVADGGAYVAVYDDTPAYFFPVHRSVVVAGSGPISVGASFWPPIELLAGYSVQVYSGALVLNVGGTIFGWEE